MSAANGRDYLQRLRLWLRWRWHHVRWWRRERRTPGWFFIHAYGCDACEVHE